jgi:hypothetical protein
MIVSLPRERVATELDARCEMYRDLGRRTIGEDSAKLFSRIVLSKVLIRGNGRISYEVRTGKNLGRRTRAQMLQSHSPIISISSLSCPLVFKAIVAAPQWQDPVYSLLFGIWAGGSGPVKAGGL